MSVPRVVFDRVWKSFRQGERHDSLRDLIPAAARWLAGRRGGAPADSETGRFWAVKDVSFEVRAGEALGIIGRNGAGKSTVLKLLTRILKPSRGSCAVVGRAGSLIEVAAGFHPDLTGRENVFLQGAILGMRRADIAARFDAIVAFAGVDRFIDTPVKRYSSGMNARLGFSIAAHVNPDVLLIDEVLAVGDMAFQQKCQERMRQFTDEGVAIVFVSHQLPAVARLCGRVLLLDHGAPVLLGPPGDVIAAYCNGSSSSDSANDDQVRIAATLRGDTGGAADTREVAAGERITIDVNLDFAVDVPQATVGVVIWDIARDLYVYGASSDAVGIAPIAAQAGETRALTFSLTANLTRGLYAIEINVVDADRHRFLAIARGIRHFQVVEQVSYDGVANLYLTGRDHTAVRLVRSVQ